MVEVYSKEDLITFSCHYEQKLLLLCHQRVVLGGFITTTQEDTRFDMLMLPKYYLDLKRTSAMLYIPQLGVVSP